MKARLPLIAALAVALVPLKASAQEWLSNPDFSEGIGIRVGNLELHPSFGAEAGYDSNFLRASADEGVVGAYKLRATPALSLSTLGARRRDGAQGDFAATASAHASYFRLIPTDSANSDIAQRSNVAIGADAKVDVFPHRKVGFDLLAGYVRVIDAEGNSDDLAGEGFNRDTLRGGAGIAWRPGGGLFSMRAGYLATYHLFESDTYASLENLQHEVSVRGRWRFLPRSAVLWESKYKLVRYTHDNTKQTDGDSVQAKLGFHGLVTYHLALMGMLGWAASFYEPRATSIAPRQFDSLVANAEARWFIQKRPNLDEANAVTGISSIALGYTRTFSNSYYGSFYQRDRGYLEFSMFILGAVVGGVDFGVSRIAFPEVVTAAGTQDSITQLRIDGRAFGEYRFTDTLATNLTFMFDQTNSPAVADDELSFTRWQAYLGVRWFM